MPQCEECKKHCFIRCLFRGKWVCANCYKRLAQKRDEVYYKALQEARRIK